MDKKLVIVDLDGTSLKDFETLHHLTKETLSKVREQGHIVAIATGRPFRASSHFYDELELDTKLANFNGGYIHHPQDETIKEVLAPVLKTHIDEVINKTRPYIENAFAELRDTIYLLNATDDKLVREVMHLEGSTIIEGDITKTLKTSPNSLILFVKEDSHDDVRKVLDELEEHITYRQWENEFSNLFEVYDIDTHKAIAVQHFSEYYGIPRHDIIAIGDGDNDIEMLEYAGVGVAMKNASDKVKSHADIVTEYDNTEGGVGHFLTEYFDLK
jgi:Cof subfamily protein (haloacid dehalogenase superfamily)